MQAEETLKNSPSGAIVADTWRGLVVIQQRRTQETPPPNCFKLLFVSHDEERWHDGSGIITIGAYDDLEIAVTIAAVRYGVSDEDWAPTNRFAMRILGEMLLQNSPIDATLLVKRSAEPSE